MDQDILTTTFPSESVKISYTSKVFSKKEKILNSFSRITQFFMWPLAYLVFNLIFKIEINNFKILKEIKSPFIIVSNHIAFYDSFIFRIILGLWTKHLPLRFMAVNRFDSSFLNFLKAIGFIDLIYSLFGVFTVFPGKGVEKNLITAIDIINCGGNIVIYPEGSVTRLEGGIGDFKIGASVLSRITHTNIVPISFRIYHRGMIFRDKLVINIGKPTLNDASLSDLEFNNDLFLSVSKLFNKI